MQIWVSASHANSDLAKAILTWDSLLGLHYISSLSCSDEPYFPACFSLHTKLNNRPFSFLFVRFRSFLSEEGFQTECFAHVSQTRKANRRKTLEISACERRGRDILSVDVDLMCLYRTAFLYDSYEQQESLKRKEKSSRLRGMLILVRWGNYHLLLN